MVLSRSEAGRPSDSGQPQGPHRCLPVRTPRGLARGPQPWRVQRTLPIATVGTSALRDGARGCGSESWARHAIQDVAACVCRSGRQATLRNPPRFPYVHPARAGLCLRRGSRPLILLRFEFRSGLRFGIGACETVPPWVAPRRVPARVRGKGASVDGEVGPDQRGAPPAGRRRRDNRREVVPLRSPRRVLRPSMWSHRFGPPAALESRASRTRRCKP